MIRVFCANESRLARNAIKSTAIGRYRIEQLGSRRDCEINNRKKEKKNTTSIKWVSYYLMGRCSLFFGNYDELQSIRLEISSRGNLISLPCADKIT